MPQSIVLKGYQIANEIPFRDPDARFALAGLDGTGKSAFLPVGDGLLSKHMLLLGGGASGKTNLMLSLARGLRANLGEKDVMVVLDPGGVYRKLVGQKDDLCPHEGAGWNLFAELPEGDGLVEAAGALCDALFAARIRQSARSAYTLAARDLMMALIVYLKRIGQPELMLNRALRELIDGFDAQSMRDILQSQPELTAFAAYLSEENDERTLGVATELQRAARELLRGPYGGDGAFGAREAVRARGGKAIFLPVEPGDRSVCAALCGLCLQEALAQETEGKAYFLLDALDLLPGVPLLADAVALGRGKGVRLVMAVGSMDAFGARYADDAPSLLSAIGTIMAFRAREKSSRSFVKSLYGYHMVVEAYRPAPSRAATEQTVNEYLIGDEELSSLQTGECIVAATHYPPFRFRAKAYAGAENKA